MHIAEFGVFLYALLTMYVLVSMKRDQRLAQPSHHMMSSVGWGLFSLSSTLALLMAGLAVTLALGFNIALPGLDAALF